LRRLLRVPHPRRARDDGWSGQVGVERWWWAGGVRFAFPAGGAAWPGLRSGGAEPPTPRRLLACSPSGWKDTPCGSTVPRELWGGVLVSSAPCGAVGVWAWSTTGCARLRPASLHPWLQASTPVGGRPGPWGPGWRGVRGRRAVPGVQSHPPPAGYWRAALRAGEAGTRGEVRKAGI